LKQDPQLDQTALSLFYLTEIGENFASLDFIVKTLKLQSWISTRQVLRCTTLLGGCKFIWCESWICV